MAHVHSTPWPSSTWGNRSTERAGAGKHVDILMDKLGDIVVMRVNEAPSTRQRELLSFDSHHQELGDSVLSKRWKWVLIIICTGAAHAPKRLGNEKFLCRWINSMTLAWCEPMQRWAPETYAVIVLWSSPSVSRQCTCPIKTMKRGNHKGTAPMDELSALSWLRRHREPLSHHRKLHDSVLPTNRYEQRAMYTKIIVAFALIWSVSHSISRSPNLMLLNNYYDFPDHPSPIWLLNPTHVVSCASLCI